MGQSLADAAVRGTKSTSIEARKQQLLEAGDTAGLIALNRSIFGSTTMMAKKDDADTDGDDEDDDEDDEVDDEDDEDDTDEDADEDDKGKKPNAATRRIQQLSAENKRYRQKSVSRGKRIAALEAEIAELKGKPKAKKKDDEEESDQDDSEANRFKEENEKLREQLVVQQLRTEFNDLITGPKPVARFKNPKAAFRLLDLDDIEVDEKGEIDGLKEAIQALAESDPYLVENGKDDEDDDEDDEAPAKKRRAGQPTASRRSKKGNPNREKLVSKYPALRR